MKTVTAFLVVLCLSLPVAPCAFAGGETFPAGHWAYDIIEQLVVRGHLTRLNDAAKPYDRLDVAKAILETDKSDIERPTVWLFNKLEDELADELDYLRDDAFPVSAMRIGLRLEENINKSDATSWSPKFRGRGRLALYFGQNFVAYNASVFQQQGAADVVAQTRPLSSGTGYTEQSYIAYHSDNFRIKFGRDYLNWGYGKNSLSVGFTASSLDQLFVQYNSPTIRFTYAAVQLDRYLIYLDAPANTQFDYYNRYFTAMRVDLNLFSSNVRLGVWQGVVQGGIGEGPDWRLLNPFQVYYGEQVNNSRESNPIIGGDFSIYPAKNYNVYGSLAIDDLQIDRIDLNDLEPTSWAGQLGLRASNVLRGFNVNGTDASIELTRVANRTYNQRSAFFLQKLTFGSNPLAHPFGNDFETLSLGASHWFRKDLRLSVNLLLYNQGEGNLNQPFTTPWLDSLNGQPIYNLETGYSEPSPSGIVQRTTAATLGIFYQPANYFNAELNVTLLSQTNAGNIEGNRRNDVQVFFRVLYELQPVLQLF